MSNLTREEMDPTNLLQTYRDQPSPRHEVSLSHNYPGHEPRAVPVQPRWPPSYPHPLSQPQPYAQRPPPSPRQSHLPQSPQLAFTQRPQSVQPTGQPPQQQHPQQQARLYAPQAYPSSPQSHSYQSQPPPPTQPRNAPPLPPQRYPPSLWRPSPPSHQQYQYPPRYNPFTGGEVYGGPPQPRPPTSTASHKCTGKRGGIGSAAASFYTIDTSNRPSLNAGGSCVAQWHSYGGWWICIYCDRIWRE